MSEISRAGIYDMPAAQYHADPIKGGSLSSTGARTIVNECPAIYRHQIENPVHKREFDIGTATHLLVLEPDLFAERVVIVRGHTKKGDFSPGYATDDAKAQRDAAYSADKTPLLDEELDLVRNMRAALQAHPIASQAFVGGKAEQSMFWRDAEFGIWCRTRPDYLPPHSRYLVDLKTAASSEPSAFRKAATNFGLHQQAAWYLGGHQQTTGERPSRFAFVVVGKAPPHLVTVHWVDAEALRWGEKLNRYARGVFAWCQHNNRWPGYVERIGEPEKAFTLSLDSWVVKRLQDRDDERGWEPPTIEQQKDAA